MRVGSTWAWSAVQECREQYRGMFSSTGVQSNMAEVINAGGNNCLDCLLTVLPPPHPIPPPVLKSPLACPSCTFPFIQGCHPTLSPIPLHALTLAACRGHCQTPSAAPAPLPERTRCPSQTLAGCGRRCALIGVQAAAGSACAAAWVARPWRLGARLAAGTSPVPTPSQHDTTGDFEFKFGFGLLL